MIGPVSRWWDNVRLNVYTVHEPPVRADARIDRAADLKFVKDGFSWGAALFGPLWLLANRLWIGLGLYLAAAVLLSLILGVMGSTKAWFALASIGLNIYLAFEASSISRLSLDWRGWKEIGVVSGRNLAECERRFLETWLPDQPHVVEHNPARPQSAGAAAGAAIATGLAGLLRSARVRGP